MSLEPGTRLGHYEIASPLGAGGMGEVYRARDVRLERTVAIKILSPQFASDSRHKQRFEREAKTISALHHPHICALYDVGSQDGVDYLVMEFVEGETLATRLAKGALPLEQVLRFGTQICDALDRAHRGGVVHRDLKPANIMLTPAGIKLLDFGLAKSVAPADGMTLTAALTPTSPMTAQGAIVGTIPYMSPEQLEGKELDGRSDIFSLGAVLYEMLTARRAFGGKNQHSVAAAILENDPEPISNLKAAIPPTLGHAIDLCLAKDREERWQTSRDLALELKWIAEAASATRPTPQAVSRSSFRERSAWGVAAVLVIALVAMAIALTKRIPPAPAQVVRSSLLPPPGSSFLPYNFAIAPDGSRMAFVALGPDGQTSLWVRGLSSPDAQQLTGTEGATLPFWSPDSLHLGFFAQGRLRTVDLVNSSVQILCDAAPGFGGSWNRDGVILFASGVTGPLYRIPATGGTPEAVTRVPQGSTESHHFPAFLPDGIHFVYFANWSDTGSRRNGVYAASLDSGAPKLVAADIQGNVFFASGHLLYVHDRTIMAQPFDVSTLQTQGAGLPLTQQEVDRFFDFWQSGFSVSQDGKLLFQSAADAPARLVWYDSAGKEIGQFPEVGYEGPQFSPDGRSLAVYSDDEHNGKHFIRIYDLKRGISARLTDGGNESNPVWSRDGKFIAYRNGSLNIEVVPADSSGPPRLLVKGINLIPCDWSADGDLIYMSVGGDGPFPSLYVYSPKNQKAARFGRFGAEPQFSPDGKWIAYVERPTTQIVVQPLSGPGAHIQISDVAGSTQPRWSRNGRKIFFVHPDRKLMVVAFDPATHSASPPRVFARTRIAVTAFGWFQYAVASDDRVLVNSLPADHSSPLTLITNWNAELRR